MPTEAEGGAPSKWSLLRTGGFRNYILATMLNGIAIQVQVVAVGWMVYDLTGNPVDLAYVGLSQFLPGLLLFLVTGIVADRYSRRVVMSIVMATEALVAAGLLAMVWSGAVNVNLIFLLIFISGAARAFYYPSRNALFPNLVSARNLPSAVALNAGNIEIAKMAGPAIGGILYAISPRLAYASVLVMLLLGALFILAVPRPAARTRSQPLDWTAVSAGFRFIMAHPVVLGAISLDLFAVLLGGAQGMLPIYAKDVLEIGPTGLGILRAAPAVGALAIAFVLVWKPVSRNVGSVMFLSVAAYGVATFVFAISTLVWLSILALLLVGVFDVISVQIRHSLIALNTPDDLRGRVNAVNQVFVGASNELGTFRAGMMAAWIGPVWAVSVGALASIGIAAAWSRLFPALRRIDRIV